jgi:hypothetical protein
MELETGSTLVASCPLAFRCTYPSVSGGGALNLQTGDNLFTSVTSNA